MEKELKKDLYNFLVPRMPRGWVTDLAVEFNITTQTVKKILKGENKDRYGVRQEALEQYQNELDFMHYIDCIIEDKN